MNVSKFRGPLFLVGMPRSGTKLLRGILNEHERVRIPDIETLFFPHWVTESQQFGSLSDRIAFRTFSKNCQRFPFFVHNAQRGSDIDWEDWFANCRTFSPAGVFEGLLRYVLNIPWDDSTTIWGDKSPSYIRHIPLLKAEFPDARFVHIIRDVRDYCLSINKAWGKSMLRAAQRWQDDVSKARADGTQFASDYLEITYEDLTNEPKATVAAVCSFLGLEFNERMLSLSHAPENLGDTKGNKTVVGSNVQKYRTSMSEYNVYAIERIACSLLRELGYPCEFSGDQQRVPNWKLRLLQLTDGVQVVRSGTSTHGVIGSIAFHLTSNLTSGSRRR